MWNRISAANKDIACQYPDDADGNAFRTVFEKFILESGYKPVDGGPYTDGTTDYTAMLTKFKDTDSQFFSNCRNAAAAQAARLGLVDGAGAAENAG
jgi:ABC-type branched-subunit amino acid transport system substrate-binding protein